MKNTLSVFVTGMIVLAIPAFVFAGEKAPEKVLEITNTELVKIGTDPIIVKAVKAENAKGKTLDQIRETDEKWIANPGIDENMQALMDSECGRHLKSIQKSKPYFAEIFVMDNQGANVARTEKTSDYWQGDEAKFKESYKDGTGAIHIGDVEFDDSSQAYLVQVSVPVKDEERVIGAITMGLDMDMLE